MSEPKSCGVLIFRREPEESFLLMRHANRLDIPKGHIDPGETEHQCALRELWEETGITADDIDLDPTFRFTLQYNVLGVRYGREETLLKTLVVFLGELKHSVEIRCTEHLGHEWVRWKPPHRIQERTIDPLLAAVEKFQRTV